MVALQQCVKLCMLERSPRVREVRGSSPGEGGRRDGGDDGTSTWVILGILGIFGYSSVYFGVTSPVITLWGCWGVYLFVCVCV